MRDGRGFGRGASTRTRLAGDGGRVTATGVSDAKDETGARVTGDGGRVTATGVGDATAETGVNVVREAVVAYWK